MKTKFLGVFDKEQRRKIWVKALDALHVFERHQFDARRMRYNPKAECYIYKLSNYQHLKFYAKEGQEDPDKIEFISKYDEGSVMFVVTKLQWTIDLFNQLYNTKARAAN
jgi:hypothetical protein